MEKFIVALQNARANFLKNEMGMTDAEALNRVSSEMEVLKNNPNTTSVATSASELVPTAVQLNTLIETAPAGRWAFLNGLAQGRQSIRSLNNEYPILGDISPANGALEWTTGGLHDNKNAIESLDSGRITIVPKAIYSNYGISRELLQYSMVDLIPIALRRLSEGFLYTTAIGVLNGDSANTATNINTFGTAPATAFPAGLLDPRAYFNNSLRKLAIAGTEGVTKINVGTPNGADDFFDALKVISFGGNPSDYIAIMDNKTYLTYMKNDDFKDYSKNGKASTITTGAMTNIAGIDLFVTDVMPLTDANGVVNDTPADNTQGSIVITKRNSIQHGFFGNVKFDIREDLQRGVLVEAVADFGFENISYMKDRNETVLLYNIDVA